MKADVGRRQPVGLWLGLACLVLVVGLGGGCREQAPPSAQQSPRNWMTHDGPVTSVAFSPDGKTLASGSFDQTIKLWDVTTGKERATLKGHTHLVTCVAYSPDGKTLASGSKDNTIKLWDVATGK